MKNRSQYRASEIEGKTGHLRGFVLHFFIPLVVLASGIAVTLYLFKTSPEAKPRKRPPTAILVEIAEARSTPQRAVISAMGEIVPAKEIDLKPRVGGEVTTTSPDFFPGGYYLAGEAILGLDPTDYELVVRQLQSEAAKAESDLALEMGNQRIATKEFSLLGEKVSKEEEALILRQPQLKKLQATKDTVLSRLDQARLDLARTKIVAPFNCVVASRMVDIGAKITESTVLARLVGTDTFWLQLSLPVTQLPWVDIPKNAGDSGSTVKIFSQGSSDSTTFREGVVIRLAAALENQGRMAQLLVRIDDPLCLQPENSAKPRLLLGSYVRAEIEGSEISAGIRLDRAHLREGNTVWLLDDESRLDIRKIDVIFRGRDHVIVDGDIEQGEKIVTSLLSSPVTGMPLRLASDEPARKAAASEASGKTADSNEKRGDNRDQ